MSVVQGRVMGMTDLAYMMFSDWANDGKGTSETSERIRSWIGETDAYIFCVQKTEQLDSASREYGTAGLLLEAIRSPHIKTVAASYAELSRLEGEQFDATLIATIPHGERETESLLRAIRSGTISKVVVIPLHEGELANYLFGGFEATNIVTGEQHELPDPLLLEAARMMVDVSYNPLSSGRGKDTVLTLIHAFHVAGYPVDKDTWLGAYFAAGGECDDALVIAKLIDEIGRGTKHRYDNRFRSNIVEILEERVKQERAGTKRSDRS